MIVLVSIIMCVILILILNYTHDGLFKRPKFCSVCGSPMDWETYHGGYDENTGKPKMEKRWVCSKSHRFQPPSERG